MTQMMRMTRCTSMPEDSARSRLSATARIALPMRVRCSIVATPTRARVARSITARSRGVIRSGPKVNACWIV